MDPRDEDELWREIVENYGDAPEVDSGDLPPAPEATTPEADPGDATEPERPTEPDPDPLGDVWREEERFVPPTPPPLPVPGPARLLAWIGLFGAPLLLLIALVAGRPFNGIWSVGLAAAFVGGFVYLVKTMSNEPRNPGDDGARL